MSRELQLAFFQGRGLGSISVSEPKIPFTVKIAGCRASPQANGSPGRLQTPIGAWSFLFARKPDSSGGPQVYICW